MILLLLHVKSIMNVTEIFSFSLMVLGLTVVLIIILILLYFLEFDNFLLLEHPST